MEWQSFFSFIGAAPPLTSKAAGQQLAGVGGWLKRVAAQGAFVATGDPVVDGRIVENSAHKNDTKAEANH